MLSSAYPINLSSEQTSQNNNDNNQAISTTIALPRGLDWFKDLSKSLQHLLSKWINSLSNLQQELIQYQHEQLIANQSIKELQSLEYNSFEQNTFIGSSEKEAQIKYSSTSSLEGFSTIFSGGTLVGIDSLSSI